jgi:hypothetical protein
MLLVLVAVVIRVVAAAVAVVATDDAGLPGPALPVPAAAAVTGLA